MQNNQRLIDANALMEQVSKKTIKVGQLRYTEGFNEAIMKVRSMIHSAPAIDAVPFETFASACKHANISCVDPDNRVYDRVCLHTRPKGQSWGTCSFETCPLVKHKDGGAEGC